MGRKTVKLEAYASLSNHNSDQDDIDEHRWQEFCADVRELASRPEYADLNLMVSTEEP
jgi:hypothetical protein